MKLIIFESKCENLYPLTYLRATFELRCGHTTLGEKIIRAAGPVSDTAYFVRDLIETTFRQRFPGTAVNDMSALKGDDLLLVDGRVLVTGTLPVPAGEGIVTDGEDVVIARITAETAGKSAAASVEDLIAHAASRLPKSDESATVIRYPWDLIHHNPGAITADFKAQGRSGVEGSLHELSCIYGPEDQCYIASGAEIHPTVVIDTKGGPVTIDENVIVFPHSRIEGPSYIGPGSQIVGGKIREGCSFGPPLPCGRRS